MIRVNLIPDQQRLARRRRVHLARWGVAFCALLICGAIPVTMDLSNRARAVALRTEQSANDIQLTSVRKELLAVTATSGEVRSQIERAAALRGKRSWSGLIAMIGRVAPPDVWLRGLATEPAQPGSNSVRGRVLGEAKPNADGVESRVTIDAPRALVVEGYTTNHQALYQLMSGLKNTGVFTSVTLRNSSREHVLRGMPVDFDLFTFELACGW